MFDFLESPNDLLLQQKHSSVITIPYISLCVSVCLKDVTAQSLAELHS